MLFRLEVSPFLMRLMKLMSFRGPTARLRWSPQVTG